MRALVLLVVIGLILGSLVGCKRDDEQPVPTPTSPSLSGLDELEQAAAALVDHMAAGEFTAAVENFDATMQSVLPAAKLQEIWTGLQAQVGRFQNRASMRQEAQQGYRVVYAVCHFEHATLDAKVVFDQSGQIAGLFFVPSQGASEGEAPLPSYAQLDVIEEQEVTVGSGEWALPGTLTLPLGGGPFPAVVLVHGSGPNDRDESIGPNKPFRDLAWGLASNGVAVLRYEKRTRHYPERFAEIGDISVQQETIDDALAALAFLRQSSAVDPDRIFILGHSLGGMLAPRIARQDTQVAGLIVMAGNSRPLEDVIMDQISYLLELDGSISDEEQAELEQLGDQVALVKSDALSQDTPANLLPLAVPASYWLDLRGYDPPAVAVELNRPILVLQGGRDYQVTAADYDGWKSVLSGREQATLVFYAAVNHLFMEGEGMGTPADYEVAGHVAAQVVADIVDWIAGQ